MPKAKLPDATNLKHPLPKRHVYGAIFIINDDQVSGGLQPSLFHALSDLLETKPGCLELLLSQPGIVQRKSGTIKTMILRTARISIKMTMLIALNLKIEFACLSFRYPRTKTQRP